MSAVGVPLVKAVATDAIVFTGASVNAKIVTIGGQVYTSATTPGATAFAYKTGADLTTSALYLKECINASGTAANFGTATTANPDVVASIAVAGTIILTAKCAGSGFGGIGLSTDETNATVSGASLNACTGTNGSGSLADWCEAAQGGLLDPKAKTISALKEITSDV
jgi:hypothetical protein